MKLLYPKYFDDNYIFSEKESLQIERANQRKSMISEYVAKYLDPVLLHKIPATNLKIELWPDRDFYKRQFKENEERRLRTKLL